MGQPPLRKRDMNEVIEGLVEAYGAYAMALVLDAFKELGFHYSTQAGITISKNDVVIPPDKEEILERYEGEVEEIHDQYDMGLITLEERHEEVVEKWTAATDEVGEAMQKNLDQLNPMFMMANSGARGSFKQIRQLAGMRGLMANPKGEIIERPIKANFMEGLIGARVLHLDPRRPQGPRGHRPAHRRLGLPDPASGGRRAGRDRARARTAAPRSTSRCRCSTTTGEPNDSLVGPRRCEAAQDQARARCCVEQERDHHPRGAGGHRRGLRDDEERRPCRSARC